MVGRPTSTSTATPPSTQPPRRPAASTPLTTGQTQPDGRQDPPPPPHRHPAKPVTANTPASRRPSTAGPIRSRHVTRRGVRATVSTRPPHLTNLPAYTPPHQQARRVARAAPGSMTPATNRRDAVHGGVSPVGAR